MGVGVQRVPHPGCSGPGAAGAATTIADSGALADPGLGPVATQPDLDLRLHPLHRGRAGRLRGDGRRVPPLAAHACNRGGVSHPGRGAVHRCPRRRRPVAPHRSPTGRLPARWRRPRHPDPVGHVNSTAPRCAPAPPASSWRCARSWPTSAGPAPQPTKPGSRPCSATSSTSGLTWRRSATPRRSPASSRSSGPTTTAAGCTPGIGYVTPDDEHAGRGEQIRQARRDGLARAARLAYHRNTNPGTQP